MQISSCYQRSGLLIVVFCLLLITACTTPAMVPMSSRADAIQTSEPPSQTTIRIWHSYTSGGAEEQALRQALEQAESAFSDVTIEVERLAFGDIFHEFEVAVQSDGGPDLLLAPNDSLISMVRNGYFAPLDDYRSRLAALGTDPMALEGMSIGDQLYGFPQSFKTVVLFYNRARIDTAPESTAELLELLNNGYSLILHQTIYHQYGWLSAHGGQLFDSDRACIIDQRGGAEWFLYLDQLAEHPNATFSRNVPRTDASFIAGRADMIINGPWELPEYVEAFGDDLGIAMLPGASQPARPLTGVDGFFLNAYGLNQELAADIALYLSGPEIGQIFTDVAGHVPVNRQVTIDDARVQMLTEAAYAGQLRPQIPELAAFWIQFDNALIRVLENDDDPISAMNTACAAMNRINGK